MEMTFHTRVAWVHAPHPRHHMQTVCCTLQKQWLRTDHRMVGDMHQRRTSDCTKHKDKY